MKKIIGGKCYNTDTARWVARDRRYEGSSDFVDETLYITKKGVYFLTGEGGGLSKYAFGYKGEYREGWGIIPMDKGEAMRWLLDFGFTSIAHEYFGNLIYNRRL